MADIDLTTSAYPGNFGAGYAPTRGEAGFISRTWDCATDGTLAAADNYKFLKIYHPKGGILVVRTCVETVESASDTLDIGTQSAGTEIHSSLDMNTLGTTAGTVVTLAASETPTTIWLGPDAELAATKFTVYAQVFGKSS